MMLKQGLEEAYFKSIEPAPEREGDIPGISGYANATIKFADQWAVEMETCIGNGETINQCAERCAHVVDNRPGFGITGNMYGWAVNILSTYWIYGEELRIWHNAKYNHKGSGVVNPAAIILKGCDKS
jgi:hypothetical protein